MTAPVTVTVPGVKVVSEANRREFWAVRNKRKKRQQNAVLLALWTVSQGRRWEYLSNAPHLRVTLTRLYSGRAKAMDTDNLGGAFKACRDAVAKAIGRDDGPEAGIEWVCAQRRADLDGVEIRVEAIE